MPMVEDFPSGDCFKIRFYFPSITQRGGSVGGVVCVTGERMSWMTLHLTNTRGHSYQRTVWAAPPPSSPQGIRMRCHLTLRRHLLTPTLLCVVTQPWVRHLSQTKGRVCSQPLRCLRRISAVRKTGECAQDLPRNP